MVEYPVKCRAVTKPRSSSVRLLCIGTRNVGTESVNEESLGPRVLGERCLCSGTTSHSSGARRAIMRVATVNAVPCQSVCRKDELLVKDPNRAPASCKWL
jgi:hypothetical protein